MPPSLLIKCHLRLLEMQGSDVKSLLLPLPPIVEQIEFVHIVEAADRKIAVEEQRKAALQALFQSMLER
jgi:restriction endonuclease S subunit